MAILSIELLLPDQTVSNKKHSPCQRLALAMAERALRDLEHPKLARDAERWLNGELKHGISFELVMDLLDINDTKKLDLMKVDKKNLWRPRDIGHGTMTITSRKPHEAYGNDPFVAD